MYMKHLLIEGYCDGKQSEMDCICENTFKLGIHCLSCPQFSYSQCPNEIAMSNHDGVIEKSDDFIGFGGDMEPSNDESQEVWIDLWRIICKKKIKEAYTEYMEKLASKNI